jgi:hypothetical protein
MKAKPPFLSPILRRNEGHLTNLKEATEMRTITQKRPGTTWTVPSFVALFVFTITLASAHGQVTLYAFPGLPQTNSAIMQARNGDFYGTTYWGGDTSLNFGRGYGMVYKVTAAGALTSLVYFNATNGGHPCGGVVQGRDG